MAHLLDREFRQSEADALVRAGALAALPEIEETRVRETFSEYEHYRQETAALIPFVN